MRARLRLSVDFMGCVSASPTHTCGSCVCCRGLAVLTPSHMYTDSINTKASSKDVKTSWTSHDVLLTLYLERLRQIYSRLSVMKHFSSELGTAEQIFNIHHLPSYMKTNAGVPRD